MVETISKDQGTRLIRLHIHTHSVLDGEALAELVNSKNTLHVAAVTAETKELIERVEKEKPDVVLLCNGTRNKNLVDLIPLIFGASPESKVLILTDNDTPFDHLKALKHGATGMVSPDKSIEVLARAIIQVADGEIWINQKHIRQLINPENGDSEGSMTNGVKNLTDREVDVIQSIASGLKNKEVAKALFISEATVRHHLSSIYSKLFVEDRLNLVIFAYQHGLVKKPNDGSQELSE